MCKTRLLLWMMLCLLVFQTPALFAADGGMHPAAQIEYVKVRIKAKAEPFYSAYRQLLQEADTALNTEHHAIVDFHVPGYYIEPVAHRRNSVALQTDAYAAYASALAWRLSGNKKYAARALYFLNAWAGTNTKYSDHDGALVMSYSGTALAIAAHLMQPYKQWKKAEQQTFSMWLKTVYRGATNEIRNRKNNWADWGRLGSMLADVFLNDATDMAENIRLIKSDLYTKIADDGHMPEEVRREKNGIWYTYFSLAPITASCWVAYTSTGENLFSFSQDGKTIPKALNYLLYFQQHPAEWTWFKNPNTASAAAATAFWPVNLFEAMGDIYNDEKYKTFARPHQPVIYEKHHFAWTFPTLMPVRLNGYSGLK
jgi:hypothetical protein